MLAMSLFIAMSKRYETNNHSVAVALFLSQLAVNLMWPSVFNSAEYLISLLMIVLMVSMTVIYAYMLYDSAKSAALLVWPYIAWVSFAGLINLAYLLNAQ